MVACVLPSTMVPTSALKIQRTNPLAFFSVTYEEILEGFSTVIFSGAPAGET